MRPRLPTAQQLLPYLERMDEDRWYANHGPLATEFRNRLEERFYGHHVALASSGTAAITAAALVRAGRATPGRRRAIIPDFTFAATAHAVEACGYEPLLFPVNPETWQLDPSDVLAYADLDTVGLIVPVGAMGRPVPQADWIRVEETTGIPVVIDGAACFEGLDRDRSTFLGDIPVAVSFHATKTFATGEGGAVLCGTRQLADATEAALNFGFRDSRRSETAATNGKLSEYHAAVGLACLDVWPATQQAYAKQLDSYALALRDVVLGGRVHLGPPQASCYVHLELDDHLQCSEVAKHLALEQIETRSWYGVGLARHPYFSRSSRHPTLGPTPALLGLPMAIDLSVADMYRIAPAVGSALAAGKDPSFALGWTA